VGVVLVLGGERFGAREAVAEILARHPELENVRLDGSTVPIAEALDEVRTPTLLGGRRAVVVEEAGALLEGPALEALAAYAAAPVRGALLVLQAARIDRRFGAAKALLQHARVVECDPPRPEAVRAWLPERARAAHGAELAPGAAEALLARLGADRDALDAALGRLRQQVAPRTRIESKDVEEGVEEHRSPALYEAAAALEAGDLAEALRATRACFAEGLRFPDGAVQTDERAIGPILLAQLHRSWVRLARHAMLKASGAHEQEAARALGLSPGAAHHFRKRAGAHSLSRLVERHSHFVEADRALKRDGPEPRQILEMLLLRLLA
jgi:DNA polymerase III delta subunit